MKKNIQRLLPLLLLTVLLTNCKKKFDEYYERPSSLEPAIYKQLQTRGNFKSLISVIDKSGYKETLSNAGYWTLFAPNDDAFTKYFTEKGISGVDKIDSTAARALVQFLLTYNAFTKETLDDYQSSAGWVVNSAFRRRTAYYTGFYDDTMQTGQAIKAIQSNRNGTTTPYVAADNNNKYITYFTDQYFTAKGLTADDYTYFYPASQFSGFNVGEAKVVNKDIAAENGIIHEIDRVISPLPSIDEYLRSKPEYSEFKRLYDKYMVSFILNADATNRYKLLSGDGKSVYVKTYNASLAFSPNNENYLKLQDNDGQQNCWTIFVPTNDVLLDYEKKVVLEYYGTFENAGTGILLDLLNAHMWQSPVWPSKFSSTNNFVGEEARFNPKTDVIDRKILSNAIFYGTNKVQDANVFSTVYSRAYLDPRFSIMTRLLNTDLKFTVSYPSLRFTLFMMPDAVLRAAGYDYNTSSNTYTYTGAALSAETIRQNLLRILNTSVIPGDLPDLATTSGIAESYNGEFIKWSNNQVISVGTQDNSQTVRVDSIRNTKNGKVYYLNGLLTPTTVNIGSHIVKLGDTLATTTSDFNYFAKFLTRSDVYSAATGEITGTTAGTLYTVFVPSNAAITQAVKDGVLPGTASTGVPKFNALTAAEKTLVNNFILYHILAKKTLVPNGKESGAFETLLKNAAGEVLPITVISQPNVMQITDMNSRRANVVLAKSNNLSNRTVIHLIDNYLKYTF